MSEREVLKWLKFDDTREIFETIMEVPKSAKEIERLVGRKLSEIAGELDILERHGAVTFSGGKWKATKLGIDVYHKYFG